MAQEMAYDESGNLTNASLLDFFLPTAVETPSWETDFTTTPSPHHPIGAKGVGEIAECRRRLRLLQCGQRRLRPSRPDAHPNASRSLAGVEDRPEPRAYRGLN